MNHLTAKTRIAMGLASLLVSVLCTAIMLGMVPDRIAAVMAGRASTCEAIAMTGSDYISRGELRRLEILLETVVERHDDVLSAGVRRSDGSLVAAIGDHIAYWSAQESEQSTETHVHVPIRSGEAKWGSVEMRFRPLTKPGLVGWIANPWLLLTAFVTSASYLLFLVYLQKMLSHLDPSKTVPRRVRSALDSLAEGLLVIDRDQRIVLANQSFATWVDRDPDKLVGLHAGKLNWVSNSEADPLVEYPWVEAIRQETPQAGVMLGIKHKQGPVRVLIANASPVLGHDGKYRGVLVSFDDVTQLEETKRDLHVAKQAAEDANQAKSEFLARMSHEIRTPMNAILGYTDVLRRGFDDSIENRHEYLNTIHGSGEHLLALINDILDLSKVESGQINLENELCSPHKLITEVITLLRSKASEKGITLEFRCDSLLPETIRTDPVRLRQTIMNLASNAIKFTATGGVTIAARLESTPAADLTQPHGSTTSRLVIDVIDTGIGIPEAAQERIFEPFAQADSSVTRKFGGTGLGLAISKQLSAAMGGGITIASEEDRGSTLTLTIDPGPLDGVRLIDGSTAQAAITHEATRMTCVIQLPSARILVADDGESNRKLVALVLKRAGLEVVTVENGQQAVDQALSSAFDAILMDMQMPIMDGYTATTYLRDSGYDRPIIALTAHAMQGDEEKCRAAGCSGFLTKPINIDDLLAALSNALPNDSEFVRPTRKTDELAKGRVESDTTDTSRTSPVASTDPHVPPQNPRATDSTLILPTSRQSATGQPSVPGSVQPIECSFPLDDPDFLEIAEEFRVRLHQKLDAMDEAWRARDYTELAALAHWLKGSGGTAGFDAFTVPAKTLEQLVKQHNESLIPMAIDDLRHLADRIVLPSHV